MSFGIMNKFVGLSGNHLCSGRKNDELLYISTDIEEVEITYFHNFYCYIKNNYTQNNKCSFNTINL